MVAVLNRVTQAGDRRVTQSAVPRITEGDRPATGTAAITLASVSLTATGKVTVSGTAAGTLFPLVLVATGTVTVAPRTGTLNVTLDDLGLAAHGHTFRPWTTEARRHQLWARDTPAAAVGIQYRVAENTNRRITEAYDARIIDGLDWAVEPRAYGGWAKERVGFTGVGNHRLTERGDRRVTEASDIRVLELGQVWFNQAASPVHLWTKE